VLVHFTDLRQRYHPNFSTRFNLKQTVKNKILVITFHN